MTYDLLVTQTYWRINTITLRIGATFMMVDQPYLE